MSVIVTPHDVAEDYQNPLYPRDAAMNTAEIEAAAREDSMHRAQSPGVRVCKIDDVETEDEPLHVHDFDDCMDYRHNVAIVADGDPWTFWLCYDDWVQTIGPTPPPPVGPPQPTGWFTRARVNPLGIQEMNGWSQGWNDYTFATIIGPSRFQRGVGPGTQTRITIIADCTFDKVFIGPLSVKNPRIATALYPLTFGGSSSGTTSLGPDWQLISDPLPQGIDASNGVMITGHVTIGHSNTALSWLATRNPESDWYAQWKQGDVAAVLDKSKGWSTSTVADLAILQIDGYYPPPP